MLQKLTKKNSKKRYNLLKKCLTLQRFNKHNDCFTDLKSLEKMKKLVFAFVAVVAISFASCGNKTNQAAPVDSDSVATVDTAAVDSAASDSAATDSVQ